MSARLNMNEIGYFSWKGRTFNQITSIIKKNTVSLNNAKQSYFMPKPLKMYRREIASTTTTSSTTNPYTCNGRISTSIDLLNMPGGSLTINSGSGTTNGIINTLDINLTSNKYDIPGTCQTDVKNCMSQVNNARRRVRSSGIIKKQFHLTTNNDTAYHTSTNQYLVSRNRTFQQNQYYYIRQGNSNVKPGDALSVQNIYSSNGINHCKKYFISADTSFEYQWVNRQFYTVDISAGNYNVGEINTLFQRKMTDNKHYFINKETGSYVYLLSITYNNITNKIELQSLKTNLDIFNSNEYSFPLDEYNNPIETWEKYLYLYDVTTTYVHITVWPVFKILDNILNLKKENTKLITFSSGAEIYKQDTFYGLSKKICTSLIKDKQNIKNLRIFNVFGELGMKDSFVYSTIEKCLKNEDIVIWENLFFDVYYINDLINLIDLIIINNSKEYEEIDCVYEKKYKLSDIAQIIKNISNSKSNIIIQNDNNLKYIGNHKHIPNLHLTSIEDSLNNLIQYQINN